MKRPAMNKIGLKSFLPKKVMNNPTIRKIANSTHLFSVITFQRALTEATGHAYFDEVFIV